MIQVVFKEYDQTKEAINLTKEQSLSVRNYIALLTGEENRPTPFPDYVSGMVDTHNTIATYRGGYNEGD